MYAKILVPVASDETSEAGLDEAIRLARICGSALRLLHVSEHLPFVSEAVLYDETAATSDSDGVKRGRALLARMGARVAMEGLDVDTFLVESAGRPVDAVVNDQARAWGADLVVLGTHGRRGVARAFAGSVAEQVVRHAEVPVLLVRRADDPSDTGLQSIAAAIA